MALNKAPIKPVGLLSQIIALIAAAYIISGSQFAPGAWTFPPLIRLWPTPPRPAHKYSTSIFQQGRDRSL
jgi:hypothetical protein